MENDEYIESSSASDGSPHPTTSSNDSMFYDEEGDTILVDYDQEIPIEHHYLGGNLEELRGRTLLDDGSFQVLPILPLPGVVLVPGQTLPLVIFFQPTINMLHDLITTNGTFGVVCVRYFEGNSSTLAMIGTTAEIYEYREQDQQNGFLVKAKGRQRFRIIKTNRDSHSRMTATVRILPDVILPDSLYGSRIQSLDRHRLGPIELQDPELPSTSRCLQRHQSLARSDALCTAWPSWVHASYNSHNLVRRIRSELSYLKVGSTNTSTRLPTDQVELSFWVVQTLALQDDQKITLLKLNSPIQRLRYSLSALIRGQILCCKECDVRIADPRDTFSMSVEGPQGTYVNPGGFVHEILTLHRARGLRCTSNESTSEYSWFPGYAWTIAECRYCSKHMGWKFTATRLSLKPRKFWGLCRQSIGIKLVTLTDEDNSQLVV